MIHLSGDELQAFARKAQEEKGVQLYFGQLLGFAWHDILQVRTEKPEEVWKSRAGNDVMKIIVDIRDPGNSIAQFLRAHRDCHTVIFSHNPGESFAFECISCGDSEVVIMDLLVQVPHAVDLAKPEGPSAIDAALGREEEK